MIVPAPVQLQFQNSQPYLRHVQEAVRQTMLAYCDQEGFAFQSRPKTVESLAEKLETGRYSRWSDIDDLYACAVIIPSLIAEDAVCEFLRGAFEEVRVTKRGSNLKDPAVFRFDCSRFVGRLRLANGGAESPEGLRRFCFEVQIRTAFEHAWLVATHDFSYKAQTVEWRRIRLAAQLKANVEQLDNLILMLESAAGQVTENRWPEVEAKTLVLQFFKERFTRGDLPSETEPKDWTRFCDNACDVEGLRSREGPTEGGGTGPCDRLR